MESEPSHNPYHMLYIEVGILDQIYSELALELCHMSCMRCLSVRQSIVTDDLEEGTKHHVIRANRAPSLRNEYLRVAFGP